MITKGQRAGCGFEKRVWKEANGAGGKRQMLEGSETRDVERGQERTG